LDLLSSVLPDEFVKNNLNILMQSESDYFSRRLYSNLFQTLDIPHSIADKSKCQILGYFDFLFQTQSIFSFSEFIFPDDIDIFTAQLKVGHPLAIDYLSSHVITPDIFSQIFIALSYLDNLQNILSSSTIQALAQLIDENVDSETISRFLSYLNFENHLLFLERSPPKYILDILSSLAVSQEQFKVIGPYILQVLKLEATIRSIEKICQLRFLRLFNFEILTRIFYIALSCLTQNFEKLNMICSSITKIIRAVDITVLPKMFITELTRKISSFYFKTAKLSQIPFKSLKILSKLFVEIGRHARAEHIHYLLASFASQIVGLSNDDITQKIIQSITFPLFDRCQKHQFHEVTTQLPESHSEVFKQLYTRWEKDGQFKGKI
jgi:hypothetical protein